MCFWNFGHSCLFLGWAFRLRWNKPISIFESVACKKLVKAMWTCGRYKLTSWREKKRTKGKKDSGLDRVIFWEEEIEFKVKEDLLNNLITSSILSPFSIPSFEFCQRSSSNSLFPVITTNIHSFIDLLTNIYGTLLCVKYFAMLRTWKLPSDIQALTKQRSVWEWCVGVINSKNSECMVYICS